VIHVPKGKIPSVLAAHAAEWTKALLSAQGKKAKERAEGRYRHEEVKAALISDFHGKCAYCESYIRHVDHGHIEHYRPKGDARWRHLTFDWKNLLLACGRCNGAEHKGTRFPEVGDGGPILNPCADEPNEHLRFVYEPTAQLASVYGRTERGATTEEVLGLNRPELRAHRSDKVKMMAAICLMAATNASAAKLWAELQDASKEYSAFARSLNQQLE